MTLSSFILSDIVRECHNSQPYSRTGIVTFCIKSANTSGFISPGFDSVDITENREELPFLHLLLIVCELLNEQCRSIPTCVTKGTEWTSVFPNRIL